MTDCTIYVGDLEDSEFIWEGGDWNRNCPARLSDEFPPMSGNYNGSYHQWLGAAGLEVRQTDYGTWVARVTRGQLLDFIADGYAGQEDLPWVRPTLPALKSFVEALPDDKEYALVATEF